MLKVERRFAMFVAMLLLLVKSGLAQIPLLEDRLMVSGEVRLRSEMDSRDFNPDNDANQYSLMRTRMGLNFLLAEEVSAFIQFQDSRTFGEEISTLANDANLGLHQGYITINKLFGLRGLSASAGRMEITSGGQRLIGAVGWHNVGRSFDGARLIFKPKKAKLEFWTARLAEKYHAGNSQDQSIHGLDCEINSSPAFNPRGYLIVETDGGRNSTGSRLLNRQTVGAQVTGKSNSFDYDIETTLQMGEISGSDLNAYLVAVAAGYTFNCQANPHVSAGIDYLSGDDNFSDSEFKSFNTLYATNHKYYGFMDYFTSLPAHADNLGLIDYQLKAEVSPGTRCKLKCDLHLFDYARPSSTGEKALGTEVDITLDLNLRSGVENVVGLSVFSPGEVYKKSKGDRTTWWLYHMLTVKF